MDNSLALNFVKPYLKEVLHVHQNDGYWVMWVQDEKEAEEEQHGQNVKNIF